MPQQFVADAAAAAAAAAASTRIEMSPFCYKEMPQFIW
jgi:hypothetical protein